MGFMEYLFSPEKDDEVINTSQEIPDAEFKVTLTNAIVRRDIRPWYRSNTIYGRYNKRGVLTTTDFEQFVFSCNPFESVWEGCKEFLLKPGDVYIDEDKNEIVLFNNDWFRARFEESSVIWFKIDENFEIFKEITESTLSRISRDELMNKLMKHTKDPIINYSILGFTVPPLFIFLQIMEGNLIFAGFLSIIFLLILICGSRMLKKRWDKYEKIKKGDIDGIFEDVNDFTI